ncbi:MAG: hypothetical protein IJ640_00790 [Prevotella sp.]|nr:hypothetical protein [Prevotella sp.]
MNTEQTKQSAERYEQSLFKERSIGRYDRQDIINAYCKGASDERENTIVVRSDNTKVIENLQKEIKTLKAQLAGYEKADAGEMSMTREEKINQAAVEFAVGYKHGIAAATGFYYGALWADEHPKSPWISVEEKPQKYDTYYVHTEEGCYGIALFDIRGWHKEIKTDESPDYWMPIPELPTTK